MLFEISVDGDVIGQLYGETEKQAIEKAQLIWKCQRNVKASELN